MSMFLTLNPSGPRLRHWQFHYSRVAGCASRYWKRWRWGLLVGAKRLGSNTSGSSHNCLCRCMIQGQIEITVGEETRRIQAGDFVTIPQGSVHAMQRLGTAEALFLDIASPPDVGDVIWYE